MKILYIIINCLCFSFIYGQLSIPIIKANKNKANIYIDNEHISNWRINPKIGLDTYKLNKSPYEKLINFKTDIDSINFSLKPDSYFDFIILFEGDSCLTRIQSPPLKNYHDILPEIHDTIPFFLTENNNIIIKSKVNNINVDLMFDSGATNLNLDKKFINKHIISNKEKLSLIIGKSKIDSISYMSSEESAHHSEGNFGWNIFDGKILEIDYKNKIFIIHSKLSDFREYYAYPINYTYGLFSIKLNYSIEKNKYYNSNFMVDTGFQKNIVFDQKILEQLNFSPKKLKINKSSFLTNSSGNRIELKNINTISFLLGNGIKNIESLLLNTNEIPNPAHYNTHILGNEILKNYQIIFDFQNNNMYIK
ncbi:hypothetical protein [Empedobacter falsenii]|uniref:hypothetical protein n=1 Tax=Empedobacter falsenii TaxID=343874 RepID=UPI003A80E7B9